MVKLVFYLHRALKKLHKSCGLYLYFFYRQPIENLNVATNSKTSTLNFRWTTHFVPELASLPRPRHVVDERFKQTDMCLLGLKNEEFVSCIWFASERYNEDEVDCLYEFPQTYVWDYDVYVVPKYRIGRLFLRTWNKANSDLYKKGYRFSLSRISAYNEHSIRSHEKLGAKRVSWACFLRVRSFQLMLSPMKPSIAFKAGRTTAPVLKFYDNQNC